MNKQQLNAVLAGVILLINTNNVMAQSTITVSGSSSTITSTTGSIGFGSNNLSTTGSISTNTLNITGNGLNASGLVTDTIADTVAAPFIMEMDKMGNVKPFNRKLISTTLFPSHKPHTGPCSGISVPSIWSYDSSFTGGAGILYTTGCQDVGVGTQTPDAAFTVSNNRYSYQISVLDTTTHTDLFTVDGSGNTTTQGTAFINGNTGIGASASSITPLWVQSNTTHFATFIATTPNGTSSSTPYCIMASVDYSLDSTMRAIAVHNTDYGGNRGPFDAFFVQANGLIYTNGGLLIHNPKNGNTEFSVDTLGNTFIPTGKMAIGVAANDMPGNYKLYVKGGILTEHCRVGKDSTADWSDYVFSKDYKLTKLDSVEEYIKQNHHLKDIPTTDDVTKNGIDVAQMDAQLLKKVEELTLYVIQLQKDNEALKKEVETLKK